MSSLFISVPLDFTIDVILRRIYREKEIVTNIELNEVKELLLLCTKKVHFSFNGQFYSQKDGIAMRSRLGPATASIFRVELERSLLPKLSSYMTSWERYVDDTIAYVKTDAIDQVLSILNSFHANISFLYEQEIMEKSPSLTFWSWGMVAVLGLLCTVNPPITISIYTENNLHQIHGNEAHLEH